MSRDLTSLEEPNNGLLGQAKQVGNMTAVGVISFMLVMSQVGFFIGHRDDRNMVREEFRALRDELKSVRTSIDRLGNAAFEHRRVENNLNAALGFMGPKKE